jgi:hypothetical protein
VSVGGERPSLRSISSDFSGFCIIGGGFFFIGVTLESFDCCMLAILSSSLFKSSLIVVSFVISSLGLSFASLVFLTIGTALKCLIKNYENILKLSRPQQNEAKFKEFFFKF